MDELFKNLDLPEGLLTRAVDLTESGVFELAWFRADALEVLAHLHGRQIVVLGGDALLSVSPLTYAYANWDVKQQQNEDVDHFVVRSHRVAREYIEHYPDPTAWFVLVLANAGEASR